MSTSVISFKRRARRRGLHALALAAAMALGAGQAGAAVRLQTGDTLGLPPGVSVVNLGAPVMDRFGNMAVSVTLGGTGISAVNDSALWQSDGFFRREGAAAPGVPSNVLSGPLTPLAIVEGGQPIWRSVASSFAGNNQGLWSSATPLLLTGSTAPGSGGAIFANFNRQPIQISRDRQVGVDATLTGTGVTSANSQALYVDQSMQARTGSAAGGTEFGTVFSLFTSLAVGAGGHAVYTARLSGPAVTFDNDEGLWAGTSLIARTGAQAPGLATGTILMDLTQTYGFDQRNTNAAGQVLFKGRWANAAGTTGESLWLDQAVVVTVGSAASGMGSGAVLSSIGYVSLNDAGQVMWAGTARPSGSLATPVDGIWRNGTLIVREGAVVPGAGGATLRHLPVVPFSDRPGFNNQGLVSFSAGLEGTGVTASNDGGLFITDGIDLITVARKGETRFSAAGSAVTGILAGSFTDGARQAFRLTFADGTQAIHDFLPDLRWRNAGSGNWDNAANWTLGLRPDSNYAVSLAPSTALTVIGPGSATTVQSLAIGGGSGVAVLNLAGGRLSTVSSEVRVLDRGVLTGSGVLDARVVNLGEVRADSLTVSGGVDNQGTVRGAATGPARLSTSLSNRAAGWVQVGPGERLLLDGNGHTNQGTIELRGGELRIDRGELTNQVGGRVVLNDGRLLALGGLRNQGQLQVSFGESEVFGAISNASGGKLILSGASRTSFYDTITVEAGGELRVSAGSSAVFFGAVNQRSGALFTGTGTKFYEGGLNIGSSPGFGLDSGSVGFGSGSLYLAEIGGTTACAEACATDTALQNRSFDKYVVQGTLTLGGTLRLTSWNSFVAQAGSTFDLFDWGSVQGEFDAIDASGFQLAAGTVLDTSRLGIDGSVSVQAVPEPGSWVLMGLGLLGMAGTLQRRRAVP